MRKINLRIAVLYAILIVIGIMLISVSPSMAEYSKEEICSSIYIIEGKEKARQPFGIETIECRTYEKCEQICYNTIENNRVRFANQTEEKDYLTFLAKRYCPPNWKWWEKTLKFYLEK